MLSTPEFILLALVVLLVFGLQELPRISRGLAKLRLHFDKGLAEDYIEAIVSDEDGGDEESARE